MTLLSPIAVRSWTEMQQASDDVQLALFRQASARPSSSDVKTGFRAFAADLLARGLIAPQELPVGVLTAVLGGGYLLWLMHRRTSPGGLL